MFPRKKIFNTIYNVFLKRKKLSRQIMVSPFESFLKIVSLPSIVSPEVDPIL